jgi:hypothetical protein
MLSTLNGKPGRDKPKTQPLQEVYKAMAGISKMGLEWSNLCGVQE